MTNSQRLTVRSSEIRAKLNELSGLDELTDEQRSQIDTLTQEYRDAEAQLRAAVISEGEEEKRALEQEPDREVRERIELRSKANLTAIFGRLCRAEGWTVPSVNCRRPPASATASRWNCGTWRRRPAPTLPRRHRERWA